MSTPEQDPFVADAVAGLCDLYGEFVQPAPGGVVRSGVTRAGKVAVVIGGGSGHYPAFAGYVGPGLADAAVLGNVFASPSARQVYDVARAADQGAGVLLSFGNYAGDVLNFGLAAERLRGDGIATEILTVTDDIASAASGEAAHRRGVAGDVVVFKVAGAAAEAGYGLAEVVRVARHANDRTRSLGVAFAGCTLPGAGEPLFTVADGQMAVGLGIHGEPGIDEQPLASPIELAALLVDRLLAEAPDGSGARAVALLNGLGATKYEELFGLWHHVAARARAAGVELVASEAGELVTSLDMAGCSLTLAWLDDEVMELWRAPVQTPAFRRGAPIASDPAPVVAATGTARKVRAGGEESDAAAAVIADVFAQLADALSAAEEELGRIDAHAGDGDHGRGMTLGSSAASAVAAGASGAGAGAASTLAAAADAWADGSGGTSGALWGAGLRAAAGTLSDLEPPTEGDLVRAARAALDTVVRLGGARPGDKTLVDALSPLVDALEAGATLSEAAEVATRAAAATAPLVPRLGRARPLAGRSVGHVDAGAVSLALCARTVADALESKGAQHV